MFIIISGSRESAFIYAMNSAAVVYAVTRSCSAGNLTSCSCDSSRAGSVDAEGWTWGGCSDDLRYGMWFGRNFVDAPERLSGFSHIKPRSLMNLHNNKAGRQVSLMHTGNCHGHIYTVINYDLLLGGMAQLFAASAKWKCGKMLSSDLYRSEFNSRSR